MPPQKKKKHKKKKKTIEEKLWHILLARKANLVFGLISFEILILNLINPSANWCSVFQIHQLDLALDLKDALRGYASFLFRFLVAASCLWACWQVNGKLVASCSKLNVSVRTTRSTDSTIPTATCWYREVLFNFDVNHWLLQARELVKLQAAAKRQGRGKFKFSESI